MMFRSFLCGLILAVTVCADAQEAAEGRFDKFRSGFNIDTLALQVLLDRNNLSCNCVDGIWGARTEIALVTWQTLRGLPATGIPDASVLEALGGDTNVLTRYTVTTNDLAGLAPYVESLDGQGRQWGELVEEVARWAAVYGWCGAIIEPPQIWIDA